MELIAFVRWLAFLSTFGQHLLNSLKVGEIPKCGCSFASNVVPFVTGGWGFFILGFLLKSELDNIWVLFFFNDKFAGI